MLNPHFAGFDVERQEETLHTDLYLTVTNETKDYCLHVKPKSGHGLEIDVTLEDLLKLEFYPDCKMNGARDCYWLALGQKQTADGAAVIDDVFRRFYEYIDRALEAAWNYRRAMRELGFPQHFLDDSRT